MRRRRFIASVVGMAGAAGGCVGPFAEDADLRVENGADRSHSVRIEVGGTVTPSPASPPENRTITTVGRDVVYFEGRMTLDAGEVAWEREIIEATDSWDRTGVSVDLEEGPERRVPVHPGPVNDGTIVDVLLRRDDFEVSMRRRED